MELKKCSADGCNPVLQCRDEMKPEDHHAQFNRYGAVKSIYEDHGVFIDIELFRRSAYEVEPNEVGASDMRVSCSKCGKASGWQRRDVEETRKHGPGDNRTHVVKRDGNLPNIAKVWNDSVK